MHNLLTPPLPRILCRQCRSPPPRAWAPPPSPPQASSPPPAPLPLPMTAASCRPPSRPPSPNRATAKAPALGEEQEEAWRLPHPRWAGRAAPGHTSSRWALRQQGRRWGRARRPPPSPRRPWRQGRGRGRGRGRRREAWWCYRRLMPCRSRRAHGPTRVAPSPLPPLLVLVRRLSRRRRQRCPLRPLGALGRGLGRRLDALGRQGQRSRAPERPAARLAARARRRRARCCSRQRSAATDAPAGPCCRGLFIPVSVGLVPVPLPLTPPFLLRLADALPSAAADGALFCP